MVTRVITAIVCLVGAASVVRADPKDDVKAAVQKLADSPSYTWTTDVTSGFGRGQQTGKTQKDGYTMVTLPLRDSSYDVVIKGDKVVIKTDSGWKTPAEMMAAASDNGDGRPGPEIMVGMMARNFRTPTQFAVENLDSLSNIQKTDDGYSADISEDAIKKMIARPRRQATTSPSTNPDTADNAPPPPTVSNASGTVKLSIADGNLTKVVFHMTATVTFNGNDRDVDRTQTTEFKDVGTTTVDVPDDAKAKLGS